MGSYERYISPEFVVDDTNALSWSGKYNMLGLVEIPEGTRSLSSARGG